MEIKRFNIGDILQLKKPHPCGNSDFIVHRTGSDVRIFCTKCQRDLTLERIKLEKMINKVIKKDDEEK